MKKHDNKTTFHILIITIIAVIFAGGLYILNTKDTGPGKYDALATCMAKNGVKFFGAFWCPHCAEQKKLFGNSAKLLPYHECSTPNAANQTQECIDEKVDSYPTWQFADGSRVSQVLEPEKLAKLSGCSLEEAMPTTTPETGK